MKFLKYDKMKQENKQNILLKDKILYKKTLIELYQQEISKKLEEVEQINSLITTALSDLTTSILEAINNSVEFN